MVGRVLESITADAAALKQRGRHGRDSGRSVPGRVVDRKSPQRTRRAHGLAARRANLERQRAEARRRVAAATEILERARQALSTGQAALNTARALRDRLPSHEPVSRALLATQMASEAAEIARRLVAERTQEQRRAEEVHAEAVDKSRRVAANLSLVAEEDSLVLVERALAAASHTADRCGQARVPGPGPLGAAVGPGRRPLDPRVRRGEGRR